MVKVKVTHPNGTIVEAEGPTDELLKLNMIPWPQFQFFTPQIDCGVGGAVPLYGSTYTYPNK